MRVLVLRVLLVAVLEVRSSFDQIMNGDGLVAVTNDDFDRLRHELDVKLAAVTVDQMNAATAISAYGERISGIELRVDALSNEMDRRFDAAMNEMNRRFDAQTAEMNCRFDAQAAEMNRRFDAVDNRFDAQTTEVNRRFAAVDDRFARVEAKMDQIEKKVDNRFGWQTVMMAALALIVLFDDVIRGALGF